MKSHELRQSPTVVINQTFQSPYQPTSPSNPVPQRDSLQWISAAPAVVKALNKFRKHMLARGGKCTTTNEDLLKAILCTALARTEQVEFMYYKICIYCQEEGLDISEYLQRLMEAPIPRKRK